MNYSLSDFDYNLPDKLIAQISVSPKDSSKLMIVKSENKNQNKNKINIEHKHFYDIINYLNKGDVLVLNNTKVMHTKLIGEKINENKSTGKKEIGSSAEITLTKKLEKNIYECHIKTKNPNKGTKIILPGGNAEITEKKSIDLFVIKLSDEAKILKNAQLTTPPYIKRKLNDEEYQTIFAKEDTKNEINSIAAPTAGLHFTKSLLEKIKKKGIKIIFIKLHVSYGTFLPVYDVNNHKMEPEYYEISKKEADAINNRKKEYPKSKLIVVGTTTLKALETSSKNGKILPKKGWSEIFIKPEHKFNSNLDCLITNFHLPRSTLIMLVSAFFGREKIMKAYDVAVKEKYRFYSLGDAMMLIK